MAKFIRDVFEQVNMMLPFAINPVSNPETSGTEDESGFSSTLRSLETYDFQVAPDDLGQVVKEFLDTHPEFPGVLLVRPTNTSSAECVGMISRAQFYEALGRPYGPELFLTRPIWLMYSVVGQPFSIFPASMSVERAASIALNRPIEQLYEPIVIALDARTYRMLDFRDLLWEQSELLTNANRWIQKQMQVGQALVSTLDLNVVLDLILQHMQDLVPYERGGILLERGNRMVFVATRGFEAAWQIDIPLKAGDVYHEIYRTHAPLSLPDVSLREDWHHIEGLQPARSWLGVPLLHAGKVIGMLSLARLTHAPFAAEEIALAQSFAAQAAIALKNAQLYNELTNLNITLENQVRERTLALQNAVNRLQAMDRAKGDFIAVASHELRTPITIISGYSQMLLNDPVLKQNPSHQQVVDGIYQGSKRLHEIVNSMLDVARIDQQELKLHLESFALADLLESLRLQFEPIVRGRVQTLVFEPLPDGLRLYADPDALKKAFYHLLVNAVKFTPDGGTIRVTVHIIHKAFGQDGRDGVKISIHDTGIGIAPEHRELIFDKLFQTGKVALHSSGKTKFKGGGPGLGLTIVRGIIEAHGGQVWAESPGYDEQTCPGSVFHVLLPLAA